MAGVFLFSDFQVRNIEFLALLYGKMRGEQV
jgi:hypothetical protein